MKIRNHKTLVIGYSLLAGLLFLACPAWSWTSGEASKFQEAGKEYRAGHFDKAISLYQELLKEHPREAVFLYNLGNSYFRKGKLGEAILAYERARFYEPRDKDIEFNLNYTHGLLEYRVEDKRNWYIRAGEEVLKKFTEEEVDLLGLVSYFLFVSGWLFCLFFRQRMPWGWKRKTLLLISVVFLLLSIAKDVEVRVMRDAIVMTKEAEVRYGPSESDQIAFRVGEGIKVYVVDHREDWSRVILVNGEGGWMRNRYLAEVRV